MRENGMVSAELVIRNELGIHMRPAKHLCMRAVEYPCKVTLEKGNGNYNAKSVLSVLSAGVKYGETILLKCDGEKEELALKELVAFISSGLGEEIKQ